MTLAGSPAYDAQLRQWCADLDRITERAWAPVPTCEGCRHFRPDTHIQKGDS